MTVTAFLAAERDKTRRAARARRLWLQALAEAEECVWRCPVCGGWRYAMRVHRCAHTTGP